MQKQVPCTCDSVKHRYTQRDRETVRQTDRQGQILTSVEVRSFKESLLTFYHVGSEDLVLGLLGLVAGASPC